MLKTHKETKSHTNNNGNFATKADLKDTEYHLNTEILATKHDLKDAKNELKGEINQVRNELKGEIQHVRAELQVMRAEFQTIDERTKTSLNISLVVLGAVLAPLVISLFPTLSKLLA